MPFPCQGGPPGRAQNIDETDEGGGERGEEIGKRGEGDEGKKEWNKYQ